MSDLTDHRVNTNSTRIVDMHGRRITNGAEAIKDSDLITFGQVKELVAQLVQVQLAALTAQFGIGFSRVVTGSATGELATANQSASQPKVALYEMRDINRPFADRIGTMRIRRANNLNKEVYWGFDDAIGAAGGGYMQAYQIGTGPLPLALQPTAGGNVLVGKTTDDTAHDLQVKDGLYVEGETKLQGSTIFSGLTASRPVHTDASKAFISALIDLANTTNHVTGILPRGSGGTGFVSTTIDDLVSNLGVYTQLEVDALLANYYTSAQVDTLLAAKATAGVQTGSTSGHTHTQV